MTGPPIPMPGTPGWGYRLNEYLEWMQGVVGQLTYGVTPAGATVTVYFSDVTGWPARPWPDSSIVVQWVGGTIGPPAAIPGVDFWIRSATIADAAPGTVVTVNYNALTGWPLRPTARTDITVLWMGGVEGNPPPSTPATSGRDLWVRSAI